ncbi:GNAT family N-acetyltransferase [Xanthomonas sp. NCPPB 2654]|uniref:GNAT family N-acetyltransferase n=1 Tax=unclassified Xanthomonas TaxID=2643310 RepID=UPI0021E05F22|nr:MULTISPECIES: GNAT family N-acetyltransferase [unclassified Xanthomonas]MDL5366253.1 GNAT family N-acetyltransferase [Xanthomonas sp. NCPPB 2654]MDR6674891.1 putative GNAT family acetyltransferase [Xanthomonas translucens]UYC19056.1 N-acetyltransferase [Xanthomonas sp. CFBP 8443]
MNAASLPPIEHDPQRQRFALQLDGHEAALDYLLQDGRLVITHTGVPAAIGGRGLAAGLVTAALAHARAQGLKVVPACSYAATFFQRHPEYADLLG